MKYLGLYTVLFCFLLTLFVAQLRTVHHPVTDNDEGIYATSFLLINSGKPAYKETFFSQPPGYIVSIYPGFVAFGKTLEAARLTIALWSIIGALAFVWVASELKQQWAGLLGVGLLYVVPSYFHQTTTLQSDALIPVFSLLALGALLRFYNSLKVPWFLIAVFFLNLSFWTKFDLSLVPVVGVVMFIVLKTKKYSPKKLLYLISYAFLFSVLFFGIVVVPFGIKEVIEQSVLLRFKAAGTSSVNPLLFFHYLINDTNLLIILGGSLILSALHKKIVSSLTGLLVLWTGVQLIFFLLYHPLFPHHLAMITVPPALLLSVTLATLFNRKNYAYFKFLSLFFIFIAMVYQVTSAINTSTQLVDKQHTDVLHIIQKNTAKNDVVLTDEEMLNVLSERLPPAELSDVSFVRSSSNDLSAAEFKEIVMREKPKLIIPWNGRLQAIQSFDEVIQNYALLQMDGNLTIYKRLP
jgi:4-amino-4-deoxy-L-arabinose transferase-like glycosyltransferase